MKNLTDKFKFWKIKLENKTGKSNIKHLNRKKKLLNT
jgi:hypothetical protein